ncbi:MAG: hypothetical protein AAF658_07815, partial [Myxococcota bacterium]
MRDSWVYALLLVVAAGGAHVAHRAFDRSERPEAASLEETLPSPYATRLLSLGHYPLAADYYWLKALSHFGDATMHRSLYPNLEPFLDRASTLDPYYKSVYRMAGTALTLHGMDVGLSNRLLERGLRYRPDVWEIPFYLGFNRYYFEQDYDGAVEVLSLAASMEGAPEYTAGIATRLAAEAGRPEVGLRLVEEILSGLPEDEIDELRKQYTERRDLLRLEVELNWLNAAAERFAEVKQRRPESLAELREIGLLKTIPNEPLGGTYRV